jgi:hypothetical protein
LLSGASSKSETSLLDRLPLLGRKKNDLPEPYPTPVKIAATWTPDTLVQTGRTPTRGFGGRVFFYDEKSRPVPVEGTLMIHGFDDSAPDPDKSVKRFEFTPEQFVRHFSQTDLGASYSIWIPWDPVGGAQRRVSLVTSFRTAEGHLIQGVPATLVLPGTEPEPVEEDEMASFSPQYLKYREASESGSTRSSGLTTTTIRRRRQSVNTSPAESSHPGIIIPEMQQPSSMVASGNGTPSADLETIKRATNSSVMPASAEIPLERASVPRATRR